MFNERGIEYVGLRELASILEMRVSNITYYFPTKDDLVYEIALQLRNQNSAVMVAREDISLRDFLEMMQQVFRNHLQFRCLLLSFVHVMEQNKLAAASYKKTQNTRNATIQTIIETLTQKGFLKATEEEKELLVTSIALISRFWISEATVSFRKLSSDEQLKHYLKLIGRLFLPYTTTRGKKEVNGFLKTVNTP